MASLAAGSFLPQHTLWNMSSASITAASSLSGSCFSSTTHCCWQASMLPAERCSLERASREPLWDSHRRSASLYSSIA